MDDEHEENIRNLMQTGNLDEDEARRLYAVLEHNDWCVLLSGADLVVCTASNLRGPDVARFADWPSLIIWLRRQ